MKRLGGKSKVDVILWRINAVFRRVLDIYKWLRTHTHTHLNTYRPIAMHAHTSRIILSNHFTSDGLFKTGNMSTGKLSLSYINIYLSLCVCVSVCSAHVSTVR